MLSAVGAAMALLIARFAIDVTNGAARDSLLLLMYATSACFACLLLHPGRRNKISESWRTVLLQSAVIVAVFVAATAVDSQTRTMFAQLLPITIMLFLVLLGLNALLLALPQSAANARPMVFVVVAALFALPVWLGPLVEAAGNPTLFSNAVVAATPLSAFAVSIDLDYLRTQWFYQHSVLGSLRYDYAPWFAYIAVLTTAIAATAFKTMRFPGSWNSQSTAKQTVTQ